MYSNEDMPAMKAMKDVTPVEKVMAQLDTDIDRLTNMVERMHNKLHGVLRKDDRDSIATPMDPTHEGASDMYRLVDGNAFQVRCATDRLQYIIDNLEV